MRPDFTTQIGLAGVIVRASSTNRPGFPKFSRYMSTAVVVASCSQYSSRSLPLTSALLPADTNEEKPMPYAAA